MNLLADLKMYARFATTTQITLCSRVCSQFETCREGTTTCGSQVTILGTLRRDSIGRIA